MAFKDTARAEAKYFQNLKTLIEALKKWRALENPPKTEDILDSCIEANKALILLYKNAGEIYNELVSLFVKQQSELIALKEALDSMMKELNEKIDDVNNYLNGRISELEGRVEALETSLAELWEAFNAMHKIRIYIAKKINGTSYKMYDYDGTTEISYTTGRALIDSGYIVFVNYTNSGENHTFILDTVNANNVQFRNYKVGGSPERLIIETFNWRQAQTNELTYSSKFWRLDEIQTKVDSLTPTQITITLPTTGWRTAGSKVFYNAPTTFDLTNPAIVTLTAAGSGYDDIFDNMERAKGINLYGCFDDDGGDVSASCLQFYADSAPAAATTILVTIQPYIYGSNCVSTVVNGIY